MIRREREIRSKRGKEREIYAERGEERDICSKRGKKSKRNTEKKKDML